MSHYSSEKLAKAIHRKTRRKYSAEEKIRIVLEGLRGEVSESVPSAPLAIKDSIFPLVRFQTVILCPEDCKVPANAEPIKPSPTTVMSLISPPLCFV